MSSHSKRYLIAGVAALCCAMPARPQVQPPASATSLPIVLTTEERLAVESAAVADARTRAIVGEAEPRVLTTVTKVDKAEAEAFLEGRSTTPPTRHVTVVIMNPQTRQAARALVEPSQKRVLAVESIAAANVPFLRSDADQALALAKADPNVRRAVGDTLERYEIHESGSDARVPFVAQALPLHSTDPRDVCSVDRCVDLIFRTEAGYLPLRAHVDLTRRTVEVHSEGGQHR
jgi:hypothetical protein